MEQFWHSLVRNLKSESGAMYATVRLFKNLYNEGWNTSYKESSIRIVMEPGDGIEKRGGRKLKREKREGDFNKFVVYNFSLYCFSD
jgi:hypothetical protein